MPTRLAPVATKPAETRPAEVVPVPPEPGGLAARLRARLNTPRLYWLTAAGLVVLALATGAAAVADVRQREALITDVAEVSGPISVDAQTLYRNLADADATAATAFLATDGESPELRTRYLDDLARATSALTIALRDADDAEAELLRVVADQLPAYTGLVETARSYQRLGVPLGGAYLREASGLMQQTILPAAAGVFDSTHRRLVTEQDEAAGFPWLVTLLVLATGAALIAAQVLVARRSRRTFNLGLVAASAITVLALLWSVVALGASAARLETGRRDGSVLVSLLANAGRAALQARANESLTLVARGGGATLEKDFTARMDELIGVDGRRGLFARALAQAPSSDRRAIAAARDEAVRWRTLHEQVRVADNGGDWDKAVELATAPGDDALPAVFARLDSGLAEALAVGNARVDGQAEQAANALRGLLPGVVLLTVGLVAAVVFGFRPRIGEYR
ncbi:hypothetical protein AB0G04_05965 [Actinoplanes sp. NPDC023801]|uniref:hypothetical protein n=1 Tax=Actinoplanes sp. NPDC023801 TaxID=3154595 RepID=UPI0033E8A1A8